MTKDEGSENKLRVAGYCEKVAGHQEKRVGHYQVSNYICPKGNLNSRNTLDSKVFHSK